MKVKVDIPINRILDKRGLGGNRQAAKFLASEVKRLCDPYVPMEQGTLKNAAQVQASSGGVQLVYGQPYAHYQYKGLAMGGRAPKRYTGKALTYHGGPMRGKEWDKRMMADRGGEIVQSLANYVGGKKR